MILMNDFKKEYTDIKSELDSAIEKTLESGWYILGSEVEAFEKKYAEYQGVKYCIGVANGLDALQISLMALGIGTGDEVITVSNTAVATVLAITNAGATPVFTDVDENYLMDVSKVEALITEKTKAIIPVHLFGQMADMMKLKKIAKKHNVKIVEDACQAHGAKQYAVRSGSIGDTGCFSFYPTKNLGAFGDGGAIVTNDEKLYEKCKMIRNYGQKNRYYHEIKGINSRLDEIQAAVLSVKLNHLEDNVSKRNTIAKKYAELLADVKEIVLPKTFEGNYHAFHLYVIQAERRDELLAYLQKNGIQALIHYPVPVHQQECYKEFNNISLPHTEELSQKILSLPIHPFLTDEEVKTVTEKIIEFYTTT